MGKVAIITGIVLLFSSFVFADDLSKKWGVGINYPGLSVKYGINAESVIEIKTQFGEDIFVIGPRYYRNFNSKDRAVIAVGGEVDYVTFKGEFSEGSGWVIGAFVGGEYFANHNYGISLDIGPAYISIKDKDTSLDESGIDFILNLGLTYYFEGGR